MTEGGVPVVGPPTPLGAAPRALPDAAARGAGVTLLTQGVRALLQFASVVLLARLLSPEDFGLVAMVTAVIGIADLIRDFGLSSAAVQSATLSDDERTNLFWTNLGLGLGCTALVIAAQPLIVAGYGDPRLGPIVLALAVVFTLSGATTQFRSDLTRRLRFTAISLGDIVAQLSGIAVGVTLAVLGYGLWALVWQQICVAAVGLLANALSVGRLPGLPRRGVPLRRFFGFGGTLFATQAVTYVTKNIDNVALGAVWGPATLGVYSRAYQLLMMPLTQINAPMTGVALPVLSRLQADDDTYARYLARAQLVACYLTATLFAVAAGLAVPLVEVLFGPRWREVAPVFAVLAIGGIFRSVQQIAYWVYLSRGHTGAQLRLVLWTRPLMIVIMLAGLPWGALGVAVGHSVAYGLFWVVSMVAVGRTTGVDTRPLMATAARAVLLLGAPAGATAWAATRLPLPDLLHLVVGGLGALAYLGLLALLLSSVRADLRALLDVARRARRPSGDPRPPEGSAPRSAQA